MNRKMLIIYSIIVLLFSIFIGLLFHELGHALMALIMKVPIKDFHIGILSYVQIDTFNTYSTQLAIISIGSFIIPELIYLVLLFFSNVYIVIFRILTGIHLYIHILMSIVILIIGSSEPETWDILMFQEYCTVDSIVIITISIAVLTVNIFLEIKNGGIRKLLKSIS